MSATQFIPEEILANPHAMEILHHLVLCGGRFPRPSLIHVTRLTDGQYADAEKALYLRGLVVMEKICDGDPQPTGTHQTEEVNAAQSSGNGDANIVDGVDGEKSDEIGLSKGKGKAELWCVKIPEASLPIVSSLEVDASDIEKAKDRERKVRLIQHLQVGVHAVHGTRATPKGKEIFPAAEPFMQAITPASLQLSQVAHEMGMHDEAIDLVECVLPGLDEKKEFDQWIHQAQVGRDAALEMEKQAKGDRAKEIEATRRLAVALANLGHGYRAKGRLDESIEAYNLALAANEKLKDLGHHMPDVILAVVDLLAFHAKDLDGALKVIRKAKASPSARKVLDKDSGELEEYRILLSACEAQVLAMSGEIDDYAVFGDLVFQALGTSFSGTRNVLDCMVAGAKALVSADKAKNMSMAAVRILQGPLSEARVSGLSDKHQQHHGEVIRMLLAVLGMVGLAAGNGGHSAREAALSHAHQVDLITNKRWKLEDWIEKNIY